MNYSTNYNAKLLRNLRLSIGQNIHNHRLRKKITLKKLAVSSGISEHMLDCYELGKYEITIEHILRISCAMKMEMERLLATE
ncbi:MAG: helix-turn-helix transcriptional regulator [Rickettsiales bacterium]